MEGKLASEMTHGCPVYRTFGVAVRMEQGITLPLRLSATYWRRESGKVRFWRVVSTARKGKQSQKYRYIFIMWRTRGCGALQSTAIILQEAPIFTVLLDDSLKNTLWRQLWHLKIQPKIKMFGWKALHNGIAVNVNLAKRGLKID